MIRALGLTRIHRHGGATVTALDGLDLTVARGEFVALMGPSGSGKSTLLQLLGCLDTPSAGGYWLDGTAVAGLDEPALARVRNRRIGFVFPASHFVDYLDLADNVALPGLYGPGPGPGRRRALALLDAVGLGERCDHLPAALSGGERQRAAIARALFNGPDLILADEPTGNLDAANAAQVLDLLASLNARGLTLVMVTHDPGVARRAGRVLHLAAGRLAPAPGAAR